MMGPSDLNRVPLGLSSVRVEGLRRYARLEQVDADPAWMVSAAQPATRRSLGLGQRLSSLFHLTRTPASPQQPAALRPSLAAVHFGGDALTGSAARHEHVAIQRECGLVATTILMAPRPCGAGEDATSHEH